MKLRHTLSIVVGAAALLSVPRAQALLPPPVLTSLSPAAKDAGNAPYGSFVLTVFGSNFAPPTEFSSSRIQWVNRATGETVFFNGDGVPDTTFVTTAPCSQAAPCLQASVPARLIAAPGTVEVYVIVEEYMGADLPPTPNAGTSAVPLTFTINPAPVMVLSLPPATEGMAYAQRIVNGGTAPFTLSLATGTLPAGLSPSGTMLSGVPGAGTAGRYSFQLRLADGDGFTTSQSYTLMVAPRLQIISTSLPQGAVGKAYSAALTATGGTPPYYWSITQGRLPLGLYLAANGGISGVPTTTESTTFLVQVTDIAGQSASAGLTIMVTPPPMTITTDANLPAGTAGVAYSTVLSVAGGSPPYSWSVISGALPPGISISTSGVLSGTPTAPGDFTFMVQSSDATGARGLKAFTLAIRSAPLTITTTSPLPKGTVGTGYSQALAANGGVTPYTWTVGAGSLPAGLALSAGGTLNGTPLAAGTFGFTVQVTDSARSVARREFTITIDPAPLLITTNALAAGTAGKPYAAGLTASGGRPPYTWSAELPAGLAMAASTGTISGTPPAQGTFTVNVQVADSANATARKSFTLVINAPPLVITTESQLPGGTVGVRYSLTFAASGGTGPYAWALTGGTLPEGLTLGENGVLSGTPAADGPRDFLLLVKDAAGNTATKSFRIAVSVPPLTITTEALPGGTVGSAYAQSLAATGGVPPYTWSANPAPAGLALAAGTGLLSGTPSAAGAFTFTAQVTDSRGASSSKALRLTVALPALPAVTFGGLPDSSAPAQQPGFQLTLGGKFPAAISGTVTLTFAPDSGLRDDPAVQFATGGRTAAFTIPANAGAAVFSIPNMAIQTGTVAGLITLTARLQSAGSDVTPSPAPSRTMRINAQPPVITGVRIVRTSNGFDVQISGYSTSREVSGATFRFTAAAGANLQTSSVTLQVGSLFGAWYQDPASTAFGSQFLFTQPFTVQGGSTAIASVAVTLTNAAGTSQAVTANVN